MVKASSVAELDTKQIRTFSYLRLFWSISIREDDIRVGK